MGRSGRATALSIGSVGVLYAAFRVAGLIDVPSFAADWSEGLLKVLLWAIPSVIIVRLAYRRSLGGALAELGLGESPARGYLFGMTAALPVLVGLPFEGPLHIKLSAVVGTVLLGPFTEEVLFRGLLFRQLYRRAGRRPLRAMTISALAFGAAHLSNVDLVGWTSVVPAAGEVGMTALGGLLFAWVAYRWDSLWPAVGLHTFMNLSWEFFGVNGGTTQMQPVGHLSGSALANAARIASVGLAIYLTLRINKHKMG
jgi:membrane protease YdiL (CAAX protease family)